MSDHRAHSRASIELRVDYKKQNAFFADYTKNISKGGTFIKTGRPLPVGTRFVFRLTVPRLPAPFELIGEVVRSSASGEDAGMGIRFVWEDDGARARFEQLVEEVMRESLGSVADEILRAARDKG